MKLPKPLLAQEGVLCYFIDMFPPKTLKKFLKRLSFYKELRYIYRSFFVYKKPLAYFYYRFIIRPKIRKLNRPIDKPATDSGYSIHLLCSHSDLDMLLWSLASWYHVVPTSGKVYIHEDGSFTAEDKKIVSKLLPNAILVDFHRAGGQATSDWLKNFPKTREFRKKTLKDRRYILAVKLIDSRFVSQSPWRLILDTDILWFQYPKEIIDLLKTKKQSFFMHGNSFTDFEFADGTKLPDNLALINSGIVGYGLHNYSPEALEKFCGIIGINSNPHFIEQAGFAYILDKGGAIKMLDKTKYIIKGEINENVAAKHYTGPRREQYWFEGVKVLRKTIL